MRGHRRVPFSAEQRIMDAVNIGFTWKAKVQGAPFISIAVIDSLVNGQGALRARLFVIPLIR